MLEKNGVSGQLNTNRQSAKADVKENSHLILSQFAFHKITWVTGFDLSEVSFKLGLCDALMLDACAGNDIRVGATVRVIF